MPFAGHPTVGAALVAAQTRDAGQDAAGARRRGAGRARAAARRGVHRDQGALGVGAGLLHPRHGSVDEVLAADPDDYTDDVEHYLWAWIGRGRRCDPVADVRPPPRHSRGRGHRRRRRCASPTISVATCDHAGQGFADSHVLECGGLGEGRGPRRRRRHPADRLIRPLVSRKTRPCDARAAPRSRVRSHRPRRTTGTPRRTADRRPRRGRAADPRMARPTSLLGTSGEPAARTASSTCCASRFSASSSTCRP